MNLSLNFVQSRSRRQLATNFQIHKKRCKAQRALSVREALCYKIPHNSIYYYSFQCGILGLNYCVWFSCRAKIKSYLRERGLT